MIPLVGAKIAMLAKDGLLELMLDEARAEERGTRESEGRGKLSKSERERDAEPALAPPLDDFGR